MLKNNKRNYSKINIIYEENFIVDTINNNKIIYNFEDMTNEEIEIELGKQAENKCKDCKNCRNIKLCVKCILCSDSNTLYECLMCNKCYECKYSAFRENSNNLNGLKA